MHDPNLHLFVDDQEIHQIINLRRMLNVPAKHPEPAVIADQPWEKNTTGIVAWGSVLREPDGRLRVWYQLNEATEIARQSQCVCYAESDDGLHWHKPVLNLIEWLGNKQNNAVFRFKAEFETGVVNAMDGCTVIRDDDDPDPAKRYKLIAYMHDRRMWARAHPEGYERKVTDEEIEAAARASNLYYLTSPDGIHFTQEPQLMRQVNPDYLKVVRDHRNRRWWLMSRPFQYTNPDAGHVGRRNVALSTTKDFKTWTDNEMVLVNGPDSDFGRKWEWHGLTPFNYGNMDLGWLDIQDSVYPTGVFELMSHRDGQPWQRVAPGQCFLDRGGEGTYDRRGGMPLHNEPIQVGDKLLIYYNTSLPRDDGIPPRTVGVATIGLDRFVALAHGHSKTGEPTGLLVTKPVEVAADNLQVNVEAYAIRGGEGRVRVAVLDLQARPVDGYTFDDCQPIDDNGVRLGVQWKDHANLSAFRGQRVMLAFNVDTAWLYSYRFANENQ